MKKILAAAVAMVLLTGCGGKETTTVCKSKAMNNIESKNEIISSGDKVLKLKQTMKLDFSEIGTNDSDIETMAKEMKSIYKGLDGVTFKHTIKDKKIEYTITYDYEKADLEELQKKGFIDFEEDGKAKYIGLKATIKGLEDQSMTCKEE